MSTGSSPPPIPVPEVRLASERADRKAMLDFAVECHPPQPWDADTRKAAVHYAKKDNAQVRRLLFIHRGTLAIAYAVTAEEPIPVASNRDDPGTPLLDTPACYLALIGILPGYRGVLLSDGRRLSHVVLDTQIEDGRIWGHSLMHTIVHVDNVRVRKLLFSRRFRDVERLAGGSWTRMVGEY